MGEIRQRRGQPLQTKEEAEALLERLIARLEESSLEVHPKKTRIVYCRNEKNKERHEHESFDSLGYTFRCRKVTTKFGKIANGFTPAVIHEAVVRFRGKTEECQEQLKSGTTEQLAYRMNPIEWGWSNYFMKYCPSEAKSRGQDYVNLSILPLRGRLAAAGQ